MMYPIQEIECHGITVTEYGYAPEIEDLVAGIDWTCQSCTHYQGNDRCGCAELLQEMNCSPACVHVGDNEPF
jgi:hypothetical protein